MADRVEVRVGGKSFAGWEKFSMRRSLEAVAGRFDFQTSDRGRFPVQVGDQVVVAIDGEPVLTGHVDKFAETLAKREVRIEGRDRTGDLVDCSVASPPFEFSDEGLTGIVAKICDPFGIQVVTTSDEGEVFERFAINPGETAFEAIERACRLRGLLAGTDGLGRLVLSRPSGVDSGTSLVEGVNVSDAAVEFDDSARFYRYLVVAQDHATDGVDPIDTEAPDGEALDLAVRKERVLLVLAEGACDSDLCQKRASWEASSRASKASTATISVPGFHATAERLWRPGLLVPVRIPTLRVQAKMLVAEVGFTQGKTDGSRTELSLVRRDAYVIETQKQTKDDLKSQWGEDVDEETE